MSRLNWKGLLVGIAVGALVFGAAPVVADIGDPLIQGHANVTHARTTLRGVAPGANLRIIQQKPGAPALALFTEPGTPPLRVNRKARVRNLNADLLDGRHGAYYEPEFPQPGERVIGAFGAAGVDGTYLMAAVTFENTLKFRIPHSEITYIPYKGAFTADCPGFGLAAEGHLCIYSTFSHNTEYDVFGSTVSASNNDGTSEFGFIIYFIGTGPDPNVRGHYVHTVPSSSPPAPDLPAATVETPIGMAAP